MKSARFNPVPLIELLNDPQLIMPEETVTLYNPLAHTNAADIDRGFFHRVMWQNAARDDVFPPVMFGRYGKVYVHGDGPFFVIAGNEVTQKYLPTDLTAEQNGARIAQIRSQSGDAIDVHGECVFSCFPGLWIWGHWLNDMLPRILLAERYWPKRFRCILLMSFGEVNQESFFNQQVRASLEVYGIEPQRLLLLDPGHLYRFHAMWDFSGLLAEVLELHRRPNFILRDIPGILAAPKRPGITAVLRAGQDIRSLKNRD